MKGLEYPNDVKLADDFRPPKSICPQDEREKEELNVLYVAMTRAQRRLFLGPKIWKFYETLGGTRLYGEWHASRPKPKQAKAGRASGHKEQHTVEELRDMRRTYKKELKAFWKKVTDAETAGKSKLKLSVDDIPLPPLYDNKAYKLAV